MVILFFSSWKAFNQFNNPKVQELSTFFVQIYVYSFAGFPHRAIWLSKATYFNQQIFIKLEMHMALISLIHRALHVFIAHATFGQGMLMDKQPELHS